MRYNENQDSAAAAFSIELLKKKVRRVSKSGSRGGHSQSRNDQRSNVHNPNNPAYKDAANNRSDQMNPNNSAHSNSQNSKNK
jgi:hypothetical protein